MYFDLVPFNISSNIIDEDLTEENETVIFCNYTTDSIITLQKKSIKWYKNNDTEILNSTDPSISIEDNQLKFFNLSRSIHNGLYKCQIELKNGQIFESNSFNMTIDGKKP